MKGFFVHVRVSYTALFFLFLAITSCTTRRFPVVRPVVEMPRNAYSKTKAQEHFIRARDYERRGLGKMAEREYERALQFDPESQVLKQQVIRIYIESGKYTQALLLIKQGRKNKDLSRDEKRIVSTIYLKMNEIKRAAWILESIKKKSSEELYSLGIIYESLGNPEKAFSYYRAYFEKEPDALQVGFKMGKMLLKEQKFAEAESLLVSLQENGEPSADIYTLRGMVGLLRSDTVTGLQMYDSALTIDSLFEEALRSKAQVFIRRSDFTAAIACYRKLVRSDIFGDTYGRTLALLYYYNKEFDTSEQMLKDLLETSMDDHELHYYLGLVFVAVDKEDLARTEFEKALALYSKYKDAWRELASIFIRKREYAEALRTAERYTIALPESAASWRLKGYIETLLKDYKNAVASFKKAIDIDSEDTYTWFELGSAYERNGEIDHAVRAFRKVLVLKPDDPATLNYLGYMWAEQGRNLDTAKVYLEKALEEEPHNGAFLDSYAWIFYQMGVYDSAYLYLKKATERIYDDPVLFHHLGDVLVKRNDLDGAVEAYRKSLELDTEHVDVVRKKIVDCEILLQRQSIAE